MKISQDIHYIGVNDHQVVLFEGKNCSNGYC